MIDSRLLRNIRSYLKHKIMIIEYLDLEVEYNVDRVILTGKISLVRSGDNNVVSYYGIKYYAEKSLNHNLPLNFDFNDYAELSCTEQELLELYYNQYTEWCEYTAKIYII